MQSHSQNSHQNLHLTTNQQNYIKQEQWDQSRFQKQLQETVNQISLNDKNFIVIQTQEIKNKQKTFQDHKSLKKEPQSKFHKIDLPQQIQVNNLQEQSNEILQKNKEQNQECNKEKNESINLQQKPYKNVIDIIPSKQTQLQKITAFSEHLKSQTIKLTDLNIVAEQTGLYYQNHKLVLTQPITSLKSSVKFRLDNIKYCVGFGVALKEVIVENQYDYKSKTNELGHGLYIVTTQGFSWSHSQKQQDDIFREGFNILYNGVSLQVELNGQNLTFKWKKGSFTIEVPTRIRQKYTLCFCGYLHQKGDAISIDQ